MKSIKSILGKTKYSEMIQSDQWRNFSRMTIRERGAYCQSCRRSDVSLQVHHISYDQSDPLMVGSHSDVAVLCKLCHESLHASLKQFRKLVFGKLNPQSFRALNGALAVGLECNDPLKLCYAIAEMASSPSSVERFCQTWIERGRPKSSIKTPEQQKEMLREQAEILKAYDANKNP